ncbi:unnamed protein product [Nezara viridula]|uniref:Uncharacterized protein n=1 Tax=Nezara viridula TaxID=85310 RepID=A0A9P0H6E7_NEZVI|nr:unnamed protein product [Nezara viridula]
MRLYARLELVANSGEHGERQGGGLRCSIPWSVCTAHQSRLQANCPRELFIFGNRPNNCLIYKHSFEWETVFIMVGVD